MRGAGRLFVGLGAILLLCAAASAEPVEVSGRHGKSWRGTVDGMPVLMLRGTHRERGEAHGRLAAREIVQNTNHLAEFIERGVPGGWKRAVSEVERFEFALRFEEELAAIQAAVSVTLPAGERQLKATGRELSVADLKVLNTADVFELFRCSQFSAWGPATKDGQLIVGRNFDYPPILPRETCCILAIQPAEKGLHATIDPLWFGLVGSGIACVRDDGLYLAPNSGGSSGGKIEVAHPTSGGLVLRQFAETASAESAVDEFRQAISGRVVLPMLFHLIPPSAPSKAAAPVIVEYVPASANKPEAITVRPPDAAQPHALFVANHYVGSAADLNRGRCGILRSGVSRCISEKQHIGFEEARAILDAARQDSTYVSVVCWPQDRTLKVAIAETGKQALQSRFATVRWDDLFGAK